jgi:Fe2+ or Zn2+ uptake regulation protein
MTADYQRMLHGASLRVTAVRLAVLRAAHDYPHASTETICGAVREDLGKAVSLQAIYDALNALTAAGLVRRIEPQGSVARESRTGTTTTTSCAGRAVPSMMSTVPSVRRPA